MRDLLCTGNHTLRRAIIGPEYFARKLQKNGPAFDIEDMIDVLLLGFTISSTPCENRKEVRIFLLDQYRLKYNRRAGTELVIPFLCMHCCMMLSEIPRTEKTMRWLPPPPPPLP